MYTVGNSSRMTRGGCSKVGAAADVVDDDDNWRDVVVVVLVLGSAARTNLLLLLRLPVKAWADPARRKKRGTVIFIVGCSKKKKGIVLSRKCLWEEKDERYRPNPSMKVKMGWMMMFLVFYLFYQILPEICKNQCRKCILIIFSVQTTYVIKLFVFSTYESCSWLTSDFNLNPFSHKIRVCSEWNKTHRWWLMPCCIISLFV